MHNQIAPRNTQPDSSGSSAQQQMTRHTMTSIEIAELVGKRHDNVKRTIEQLAAGKFVQPQSEDGQFPDSLGRLRSTQYFIVNKRDSHVIVAQLSPAFTARLVDRWQELEDRAAGQLMIPTNLPDALRLAADKAEENERLLGVIQLQAPKVAAIQRLAAACGAICITDAAKQLQVQPSKLFAWLQARKWIFHRGGSKRWTAYQPQINKGYMVHKVTELKPDAETGAERAAFQPLITPKGLAYLAEKNIGGSL